MARNESIILANCMPGFSRGARARRPLRSCNKISFLAVATRYVYLCICWVLRALIRCDNCTLALLDRRDRRVPVNRSARERRRESEIDTSQRSGAWLRSTAHDYVYIYIYICILYSAPSARIDRVSSGLANSQNSISCFYSECRYCLPTSTCILI